MEIMRLAMITRTQAEKSSPAAQNIVMVMNESEPAISNAEILKLLQSWKRHGKVYLSEYYFERELKLPHDIITPGTPGVPIGDVHPRLIAAVKDIHAHQ
jgi:hypothetical protein